MKRTPLLYFESTDSLYTSFNGTKIRTASSTPDKERLDLMNVYDPMTDRKYQVYVLTPSGQKGNK